MKGKVQTVLGLIDPTELGRTLTHEHLLHSTERKIFFTPLPAVLQNEKIEPFRLDSLYWIKQYPYSFEENLRFNGDAVMKAVRDEMVFFKKHGGSCIVENSSVGLRAKNQADFLKTLSMETAVKIVSGTGFYVAGAHSGDVKNYTEETMVTLMKKDILDGIDGSDVKCGVVGELGCSWPLLPFEKRVLLASAAVQEELKCPVIIHPGRSKDSPEEIIRVFQEGGGNISHTVMSHLDRTLTCEADLLDYASLGGYCEMDLFGTEVITYQIAEDIDMPSDIQRIHRLKHLVDNGYSDKIVISHDIHTRHRLMNFGGHGYSHIFLNVIPKMIKCGISTEVIDKILIHNPRSWLTFQ